jgi:hypothetical protein
MEDDLNFLELWLEYGNKWREISQLIKGRTESQLKNRFKLLLRKKLIQQSKTDNIQLKTKIIPELIDKLKYHLK